MHHPSFHIVRKRFSSQVFTVTQDKNQHNNTLPHEQANIEVNFGFSFNWCFRCPCSWCCYRSSVCLSVFSISFTQQISLQSSPSSQLFYHMGAFWVALTSPTFVEVCYVSIYSLLLHLFGQERKHWEDLCQVVGAELKEAGRLTRSRLAVCPNGLKDAQKGKWPRMWRR